MSTHPVRTARSQYHNTVLNLFDDYLSRIATPLPRSWYAPEPYTRDTAELPGPLDPEELQPATSNAAMASAAVTSALLVTTAAIKGRVEHRTVFGALRLIRSRFCLCTRAW